MSPRTGRPPKENPRKINLNIRLTEQEANDIQMCADELHVSRTDAIMRGIHMVKSELKKNRTLPSYQRKQRSKYSEEDPL